ncbi:uncharacterized protein LOC133505350 [Syngnathoides biaculeatus]|uniref:uncharacterized protein LOC133505350 n=1 Tax=Syngnathoides biaculeatus TaxID=300417 RepID=UPI002ADE6E7A|nr:uncharacterized protein LOC133505350 [Syngnathoides biaculeatus]
MFSCCLTLATLASVWGNAAHVLMVAPPAGVDVHPQAEATIPCGGKGLLPPAGAVAYWHTPFGPVRTPGLHDPPGPVHMLRDGRLALRNLSELHRGLYYCLLRHDDGGATLFPYQLRTRGGTRSGKEAEDPEAVSDNLFAGAVTAAVLLAFTLGFSAGALSRTQILRCSRAVAERFSSPRRPDITMTTLGGWASLGSSQSSSSPPPKPQRSFQGDKRGKGQREGNDGAPAAAYLEACDQSDEGKGNERGRREEDGGGGKDEGVRNNEDERMKRNDDDEDGSSQSSQSDGEAQKQEAASPPLWRPSRVIRVYQYDQDGRPYGHLPVAGSGPVPAPKQRTASLSHLNAIMAPTFEPGHPTDGRCHPDDATLCTRPPGKRTPLPGRRNPLNQVTR